MWANNVTVQPFDLHRFRQNKEAPCHNGKMTRALSSLNLRSNNGKHVFHEGKSEMCSDKLEHNTSDLGITNVCKSSRSLSPPFKRADSRASSVDPEKAGSFEVRALERENNQVMLRAPSSPKLQSIYGVSRRRSLPVSHKLANSSANQAASDTNAKNVFTRNGSPASKSAEATAITDDPGREGRVQANKLNCRGAKLLQKRSQDVSITLPLPEKPETENQVTNQIGSTTETELEQNEESFAKFSFCDICNYLALPVSQSKFYLSVDRVPLQRRSTGDRQELCAKELNLEEDSPHEIRKLSTRDRASSMSKLLDKSEEKTFANITAFNLAAQHSPGTKTVVRFREITEPVKKSKWFHALSTVVSLGDFQTAMMEIQKQREQEKALEENRPSMATNFEREKEL